MGSIAGYPAWVPSVRRAGGDTSGVRGAQIVRIPNTAVSAVKLLFCPG